MASVLHDLRRAASVTGAAGTRRTSVRERLTGAPAQVVLLVTAVFVVYRCTGSPHTQFDHYLRLTDAFLHGDLYLTDPPDNLELARFFDDGSPCRGPEPGCHGYVIDPPSPTLLILPFRFLFGRHLNASVLSQFWGAVAVGIFWLASGRLGWRTSVRSAVGRGGIGLTAIPHVLHGVTGWSQFGYRYTLDYLPALMFLTASGLRDRPPRRAWLLIGVSVFMSAWGPLYFFDTPLEGPLHHDWRIP